MRRGQRLCGYRRFALDGIVVQALPRGQCRFVPKKSGLLKTFLHPKVGYPIASA